MADLPRNFLFNFKFQISKFDAWRLLMTMLMMIALVFWCCRCILHYQLWPSQYGIEFCVYLYVCTACSSFFIARLRQAIFICSISSFCLSFQAPKTSFTFLCVCLWHGTCLYFQENVQVNAQPVADCYLWNMSTLLCNCKPFLANKPLLGLPTASMHASSQTFNIHTISNIQCLSRSTG